MDFKIVDTPSIEYRKTGCGVFCLSDKCYLFMITEGHIESPSNPRVFGFAFHDGTYWRDKLKSLGFTEAE